MACFSRNRQERVEWTDVGGRRRILRGSHNSAATAYKEGLGAQVVGYLVQLGVIDLEARNKKGRTALMQVCDLV